MKKVAIFGLIFETIKDMAIVTMDYGRRIGTRMRYRMVLFPNRKIQL